MLLNIYYIHFSTSILERPLSYKKTFLWTNLVLNDLINNSLLVESSSFKPLFHYYKFVSRLVPGHVPNWRWSGTSHGICAEDKFVSGNDATKHVPPLVLQQLYVSVKTSPRHMSHVALECINYSLNISTLSVKRILYLCTLTFKTSYAVFTLRYRQCIVETRGRVLTLDFWECINGVWPNQFYNNRNIMIEVHNYCIG